MYIYTYIDISIICVYVYIYVYIEARWREGALEGRWGGERDCAEALALRHAAQCAGTIVEPGVHSGGSGVHSGVPGVHSGGPADVAKGG